MSTCLRPATTKNRQRSQKLSKTQAIGQSSPTFISPAVKVCRPKPKLYHTVYTARADNTQTSTFVHTSSIIMPESPTKKSEEVGYVYHDFPIRKLNNHPHVHQTPVNEIDYRFNEQITKEQIRYFRRQNKEIQKALRRSRSMVSQANTSGSITGISLMQKPI